MPIRTVRVLLCMWMWFGCSAPGDSETAGDHNQQDAKPLCATLQPGESLAQGEPCPLGTMVVEAGARVWQLDSASTTLLGQGGSHLADDPRYVLDAAGFIQGVTLQETTWPQTQSVRIYGYDDKVDGVTPLALITWNPAQPAVFAPINPSAVPSITEPEPVLAADGAVRTFTANDRTAVYALKSNGGLLQLRMVFDSHAKNTPVGLYGQFGNLVLSSPWIQFMRTDQLQVLTPEATGFLKDGCTNPADPMCICVAGEGLGSLRSDSPCTYTTTAEDGSAQVTEGRTLNPLVVGTVVLQPLETGLLLHRIASLAGIIGGAITLSSLATAAVVAGAISLGVTTVVCSAFPTAGACQGLMRPDPLQERLARAAMAAGGTLLFATALTETIEGIRTAVRTQPQNYSRCQQRVNLIKVGTVIPMPNMRELLVSRNAPTLGLNMIGGMLEGIENDDPSKFYATIVLGCVDEPGGVPYLGPLHINVYPDSYLLVFVLNVSNPGVVKLANLDPYATDFRYSHLEVFVNNPGNVNEWLGTVPPSSSQPKFVWNRQGTERSPFANPVSPGHGPFHPYLSAGAFATDSILDELLSMSFFQTKLLDRNGFRAKGGGGYQTILFYPPHYRNFYRLMARYFKSPTYSATSVLLDGFQHSPFYRSN